MRKLGTIDLEILFLAIKEKNDKSFIKEVANDLINTRPTAINLKWSVERMLKKLNNINENKTLDTALNEANKICEEDKKFCKKIMFTHIII